MSSLRRILLPPAAAIVLVTLGCIAVMDGELKDDTGNGVAVEHGRAVSVSGGIVISKDTGIATAETVNGAIAVDPGAEARALESVNGTVALGAGARARSIETVNGAISLDTDSAVEDAIETVNGSIRMARGSRAGSIETVNGPVSLAGAAVREELETVNGNVTLSDGASVGGDVVFRRPRGKWDTDAKPILEIGKGCSAGRVVAQRPIILIAHPGSAVGETVGDVERR